VFVVYQFSPAHFFRPCVCTVLSFLYFQIQDQKCISLSAPCFVLTCPQAKPIGGSPVCVQVNIAYGDGKFARHQVYFLFQITCIFFFKISSRLIGSLIKPFLFNLAAINLVTTYVCLHHYQHFMFVNYKLFKCIHYHNPQILQLVN
jgi:hypothetical protein